MYYANAAAGCIPVRSCRLIVHFAHALCSINFRLRFSRHVDELPTNMASVVAHHLPSSVLCLSRSPVSTFPPSSSRPCMRWHAGVVGSGYDRVSERLVAERSSPIKINHRSDAVIRKDLFTQFAFIFYYVYCARERCDRQFH